MLGAYVLGIYSWRWKTTPKNYLIKFGMQSGWNIIPTVPSRVMLRRFVGTFFTISVTPKRWTCRGWGIAHFSGCGGTGFGFYSKSSIECVGISVIAQLSWLKHGFGKRWSAFAMKELPPYSKVRSQRAANGRSAWLNPIGIVPSKATWHTLG